MSCYREKAVDKTFLEADITHGSDSQSIVSEFFTNDCDDTTTLTSHEQACTELNFGADKKESFIPTSADENNLKRIVALLIIPSAMSANSYDATKTYSSVL